MSSSSAPVRTLGVLFVAVAFVATGCGKDDTSTSTGTGSGTKPVTIEASITDNGCDPANISAKAGPTTIHVTNDDADAVSELEVQDKKGTILGEVENVTPGLDRSFSLTLKPGSYVTYCPGGKHEKGTLEVAKSGTGKTADSAATEAAVKTYLDKVAAESAQLTAATTTFVDAVKAGDVEKAKETYAPAREHYESIEPIAESFGDLDPKIDAREGDVPADQFGGFHRIEKQLWEAGNVDGMAPVADQLLVDVKDLQSKIPGIHLEPAQIANGAVELLNEVSSSKITGEEDRYSHTDLSDFAANVAGSKFAFDAVKPLLAADDADLSKTIDQRFADVDTALSAYEQTNPYGNGYVLYTSLTPADTQKLSATIDALAEPLSKVAAQVIS
jgi:iron uptake system component EfeO